MKGLRRSVLIVVVVFLLLGTVSYGSSGIKGVRTLEDAVMTSAGTEQTLKGDRFTVKMTNSSDVDSFVELIFKIH